MLRSNLLRALALVLALVFVAAACGDDSDGGTAAEGSSAPAESTGDDASMTEDSGDEAAAPADSSTVCDTDALVQAVESGPDEGTLAGMTDDPVGTAASSNPVLTTLVTAVSEADLVDTLNSAESLTVFAPTDCAFAALDPATLDAALADPTGLLTTVLGFHVVPGDQLSSDDLATTSELETFTGEVLPVSTDGGTVTVGEQAEVVVPDIQTANATVHLIDSVMLPPSAG
jgi:uncharacterized surface protein with fasciclin (FAS1) repeats